MIEEKLLTRAKNLAYRYLALRPRSKAELQAYLVKKGVPEDAASEALEALEGYGYIDDKRFASGYAIYLVEYKGLSPRAVRFELKKKGVSDTDMGPAIEGLFGEGGIDEEAVALKVAQKKAATLKGVDREKARRRLMDHLRRRGFSFDIIRRVLKTSLI